MPVGPLRFGMQGQTLPNRERFYLATPRANPRDPIWRLTTPSLARGPDSICHVINGSPASQAEFALNRGARLGAWTSAAPPGAA